MSDTPLDRIAERLRDVLDCIGRIETYVAGYDFEKFAADLRTVDAVVRNLEIIGEAVGHLPKDLLDRQPGIPWRDSRDARNVFAHDYGRVDDRIVWRIVSERLGELAAAVRQLLDDRAAPTSQQDV